MGGYLLLLTFEFVHFQILHAGNFFNQLNDVVSNAYSKNISFVTTKIENKKVLSRRISFPIDYNGLYFEVYQAKNSDRTEEIFHKKTGNP